MNTSRNPSSVFARRNVLFLGPNDTGDIHERYQGAVDRAVGTAVGQDAHQIMRAAVLPLYPPFHRLQVTHDRPHVVPQRRIAQLADDVGQRTADIARNQIVDAGDLRRETADDHILIQKDRRDLGIEVDPENWTGS
jgi:hypothetical protein